MADIGNILFSLGLIAFGLLAGYYYRNYYTDGRQRTEDEISSLRKKLQATSLLYVNPVAFGGAIWALELSDIRIFSLPFLGVFALILGGVLAYVGAKALRLNRKQTGVYVTCGSFTNIGSIGGLVTFMLLGEQAVALMPFYMLFEPLIYYGVGFPYAKSMSDSVTEHENAKKRLLNIVSDRFIVVAMASMIVGLLLNAMGVERPGFYSTLNSILIPLGTVLLLSSIGMAMRFGKMRGYLREAGSIALIKFIMVPGSVYLLGSLIGLGSVDGGLPLKVSVILASMPVAFTAMVPPTLYDLDVDLANAAWFLTTILLLVVVPALSLILS
ncbi:MAG: hypothetical protein NWE89_16415 [Candidatus Bathyarchaeota archaeon]|nr:hypothetical protein [Candidatus Bathyarchaeota archaeon]